MAVPVVLHNLNTLKELTSYMSNLTIIKLFKLQIVEQFSHRRKLLNDINDWSRCTAAIRVLALLADAMESYDVRMGRKSSQRFQLGLQILQRSFFFSIIVELENFDGKRFAVLLPWYTLLVMPDPSSLTRVYSSIVY